MTAEELAQLFDEQTMVFAKNVNTLIATTPSGKSHYITKTKNFKHKEFTKTINRVSANTVSDLNKHGKKMDRWLKKNAAKFGFTYEFK